MSQLPTYFWWAFFIGSFALFTMAGAYVVSAVLTHRRIISEQRFSTAILDAAAAFIIVVDHSGGIFRLNAAFEEIAGINTSQILHQHIKDVTVFSSELRAFLLRAIKSENMQNQRLITEEICSQKAKHVIKWQITTLIEENGELRFIIASGLEITRLIERERQLRQVAAELSFAEARERRIIADGLHADVSSRLALIKRRLLDSISLSEQSKSQTDINETIREIDHVIKVTRSLIFELSPPVLQKLGLKEAIKSLIRYFNNHQNLVIEYNEGTLLEPVDEKLSIFLYQSVREILVNTIKYSRATFANVTLNQRDNKLIIIVKDDGIGFDKTRLKARTGQTGGFGLFNIADRLDYFGGALEIETAPEKGTKITIIAPMNLNL